MDKREWKPGDVAMVGGCVAFVWDEGDDIGGRLSFVYTDQDGDSCSTWADGTKARPLVVIDPEDREQVERLRHMVSDLVSASQLREALDHYLAPKPDEPLAFGAVVEDNEGRLWVRADDEEPEWRSAGDWRCWCGIDAVRTLSRGVSK